MQYHLLLCLFRSMRITQRSLALRGRDCNLGTTSNWNISKKLRMVNFSRLPNFVMRWVNLNRACQHWSYLLISWKSWLCWYATLSNSDWLLIAQSRELHADRLIMNNNGKATLLINMPYCIGCLQFSYGSEPLCLLSLEIPWYSVKIPIASL